MLKYPIFILFYLINRTVLCLRKYNVQAIVGFIFELLHEKHQRCFFSA